MKYLLLITLAFSVNSMAHYWNGTEAVETFIPTDRLLLPFRDVLSDCGAGYPEIDQVLALDQVPLDKVNIEIEPYHEDDDAIEVNLGGFTFYSERGNLEVVHIGYIDHADVYKLEDIEGIQHILECYYIPRHH